MTQMTRRTTMLATTGALAALLVGCASLSGTTVNAAVAQAEADLQAIGAAVPAVLAAVQAFGANVAADTLTKITDAINLIETDAAKIGTALTSTQGTLVQQILSALPTLATFLTPLGLPAAVMAIITAAVSLAPSIAAAFGLTAATAAVVLMDPAKARAVLAAAKSK